MVRRGVPRKKGGAGCRAHRWGFALDRSRRFVFTCENLLASAFSVCDTLCMATTLAPAQIRQTRLALGLTSGQFANVLGVHPTTVSRWENASGPVVVEGMAFTVLSALRLRLAQDRRAEKTARETGKEVSDALVVGGVVLALALLVAFAAGKE